MPIKTGDRLPEAMFRTQGTDGPETRTTSQIFSGKKVVLFAVPGAFTPTCHNNHLPGFVENAAAFKAKGVETIAVTAVNDVFVMNAWQKAADPENKLVFLADGNAEFAKAIDMSLDGSAHGLGTRSQRYAMLVEDGVIKLLNLEPSAGQAEASSAKALLAGM